MCVDGRRLRRWLGTAPVMPDGAVLSWVDDGGTGYRYPEAAGLLLSLLADAEDPTPSRIARWLCSQVSPEGAVGRNGIGYLFDTAVALAGLLTFEEAGGMLPDASVPERMLGFLVASVERQRGAHGPPGAPLPDRWSTCFGPHLLKVSIAVDAYCTRRDWQPRHGLVGRLLEILLPLQVGGRFRLHAGAEESYLHQTCYGLEGLVHLWRTGEHAAVEGPVRAGAAWLAGVQRDDGLLPNWHDGDRGWGAGTADVAAQAVRIWAAVDAVAYAEQIRRSLTALARLQHPAGGIRYREDCRHLNTWAGVFAAQAVAWSAGDVKGRLI